jgi:hypothetical protein
LRHEVAPTGIEQHMRAALKVRAPVGQADTRVGLVVGKLV